MTRMLVRHGCMPLVIEASRQIQCTICLELSRRSTEPQASAHAGATQFRDVVLMDEFWVILTDNTSVCLIMLIDEASLLAVAVPLQRSTTSASAEEIIAALEMHWLPWAGPMRQSRCDPHKSHIAKAIVEFCRAHG